MASTLTRRQKVALKTWNPANLHALWDAARKADPSRPATPATGFSPNVGGFTPFKMPDRPPPGTYDPSLDAAAAASGRGYEDLSADTGIANQRAQDDFTLQTGLLQKHLDTALSDLHRNYTNLGDQQAQQANAMGVYSGGALQQALEKRMANEQHDAAPLNEQFKEQTGQLGLDLSRGNEDRANTLSRAGRENTQFGVDTSAQRWFQATQAGYDPPQKSATEHGSGSKAYRYVRTPRGTRRLLSTGYLIGR